MARCLSIAFAVGAFGHSTVVAAPVPGPPGPLTSQVLSAGGHPAASDAAELRALGKAGKWSELAAILRERLASPLLGVSLRTQWTLELGEALARLGRQEEALLLWGELSRDSRVKSADRAIAQRRAVALSRIFSSADAAERYQRALVHFQADRLLEARQILQSILTDEPAQLDSLVRLGQLCLLQSDWDSGVEHLRRARMLNPFESVISLWLGKALLERGEWVSAQRELLRALDDADTREQANEWLIDLEVRSGNTLGASRWIASGLSRFPRSPGIWGAVLRSGVILNARQWKRLRKVASMEVEPRDSGRRFDDSSGLGCSWKTRQDRLVDLRDLISERESVSR